MKKSALAWGLILLIGILLATIGCSKKSSNEKIIFGIGPSTDAEKTNYKIEVISKYFSEKLGVEVGHILVTNANAMIEAMRANKIDVGAGGPFTYLVAAKKAGAEAIITTQTPNGETDYYRALLITQKDSPINSMEDLKKYAKDITLSWAYPTSASGHLVPRYYLQKLGIYATDFKEVFTSTDHTSAIFTAISGKVDVAAVYKSGIEKFIRDGRITEDDFKIIWESESLLPSPTFVRSDLPEELKKKIQDAYLTMREDSPEAWSVFLGQYSFPVEYRAVSDKDYDYFRHMASEIEDLKLFE
jgi:phosphonate transport system substrate-binding protein